MIDIDKQVAYWRAGANEDWDAARDLIRNGHARHGLFFVHLALEKLLKAHICLRTQEPPPKIHNLVRLAELSGLSLTEMQIRLLARANEHNIEGRYPDVLYPAPSRQFAREFQNEAKEVYEWLLSQL